MANSLRAKLSKLRHDRHITEEEYQELIKKLDGHDAKVRKDAIDECIKVFRSIPRHYYRDELLNELEQLKDQQNEQRMEI